jgi:hypothetical protein
MAGVYPVGSSHLGTPSGPRSASGVDHPLVISVHSRQFAVGFDTPEWSKTERKRPGVRNGPLIIRHFQRRKRNGRSVFPYRKSSSFLVLDSALRVPAPEPPGAIGTYRELSGPKNCENRHSSLSVVIRGSNSNFRPPASDRPPMPGKKCENRLHGP